MLARDVRLGIGYRISPRTLFPMAAVLRPPRCVRHRGRVGQDARCGKTPVFMQLWGLDHL